MVYVLDIVDGRYQFVEKKRSASNERGSKCNESRRISKLRSPGSCWNTPGPEAGGYGITFAWRSDVLVLDSEERKDLWVRGVRSSEEPLSEKLSMLNPKPGFSTSFEPKTDANDAEFVSFPRESGPSSIYVGVCGPEVVQTDVTDEGVQEVERRIGVVQLESSKFRDMGEEGVGDEKEKSLCKLSIEKRRFLFFGSIVAVGVGEPVLRRISSCRGSFS